ncbi:hypothetical protein ACSBL2_07455 [Pedobacter sp. AW31-3R]|uniref:hypothetical protein n=1 Tax=Pedobacter sp. AW31-3R TaxID=3445781 RepID=UPI003F9EDA6C
MKILTATFQFLTPSAEDAILFFIYDHPIKLTGLSPPLPLTLNYPLKTATYSVAQV